MTNLTIATEKEEGLLGIRIYPRSVVLKGREQVRTRRRREKREVKRGMFNRGASVLFTDSNLYLPSHINEMTPSTVSPAR